MCLVSIKGLRHACVLDFGLIGLRIDQLNPQSAIRNPKSFYFTTQIVSNVGSLA